MANKHLYLTKRPALLSDRTGGTGWGVGSALASSCLAPGPGPGPRTWARVWSRRRLGPGAGRGMRLSDFFLNVAGGGRRFDVLSWRCGSGAGSLSGDSPGSLLVSEGTQSKRVIRHTFRCSADQILLSTGCGVTWLTVWSLFFPASSLIKTENWWVLNVEFPPRIIRIIRVTPRSQIWWYPMNF